jgi:branched-subunit amino acid ABC-type transport system permease component
MKTWFIGVLIAAIGGIIISQNSSQGVFWGVLILVGGYTIAIESIKKDK